MQINNFRVELKDVSAFKKNPGGDLSINIGQVEGGFVHASFFRAKLQHHTIIFWDTHILIFLFIPNVINTALGNLIDALACVFSAGA